MRRSSGKRVVAGLLLAWFAIVQTAPEAVHTCPVHDAHGGGVAHMHGAGMAAMPPGHMHEAASSDAPHSPSRGRLQCTCMEQCALCTAGAQLAAPPCAPTAVITQVSSATVTFVPQPPAAPRAHVLPFANGPPRA